MSKVPQARGRALGFKAHVQPKVPDVEACCGVSFACVAPEFPMAATGTGGPGPTQRAPRWPCTPEKSFITAGASPV